MKLGAARERAREESAEGVEDEAPALTSDRTFLTSNERGTRVMSATKKALTNRLRTLQTTAPLESERVGWVDERRSAGVKTRLGSREF